jgi:hypothetical protein
MISPSPPTWDSRLDLVQIPHHVFSSTSAEVRRSQFIFEVSDLRDDFVRLTPHDAELGERRQDSGDRLSGSKRITWRFLQSELDAMLTLPSAAELRRVQ